VITRRSVVGAGALGIAAWSACARAQHKVYRVGIIGYRATAELVGAEPRSPQTAAFVRGMRELGYRYGEHFVTEARGADGKPERFPSLAAELVGLQVDVIVAAGNALPALKQATSTVPIVMAAAGDPVGSGYVRSLGRPGGNITGLSFGGVELAGKQLELLKELVPSATTVAVLRERGEPLDPPAAEAVARARGWKLLLLEVREAGDIEAAFKAAMAARADALAVPASPLLFVQARRVTELAARYQLPTIYELRPFVEAGGLMSYSADLDDIWRHAASYVDKILKGAKPADLPVEQPTKFEFVINLKTAKALGLAMPQSLLLRADEVIR
jgi:putative tryptophan/tyrosine transport system substrate-binding protein